MPIEMWVKARTALSWKSSVLVASLMASGCTDQIPQGRDATPIVAVDFSNRTKPSREAKLTVDQNVLRIAVAGMTSPSETLRSYEELPHYFGEQLGVTYRMIQRRTYQEVNDLLVNGELDVAFLCSGGYVAGGQHLASEIVGVPMIRGKTSYQAYIIVHQESRIHDFAGLRQHSFAFTDPLSNTGWLYPVYKLTELGVTPSAYFAQVTYTHGHDWSIEAVASKIVDGASVDSLVYQYLSLTAPEKVKAIRIVERSPEFGNPPVVASPKMDIALKQKFRNLLLSMHQDETGSRILRELMIDKFVPGNKKAYDPIRRMAVLVGPWRP